MHDADSPVTTGGRSGANEPIGRSVSPLVIGSGRHDRCESPVDDAAFGWFSAFIVRDTAALGKIFRLAECRIGQVLLY